MRWIAHDLADGDAVASEIVTAEEYEVVFAEEFARLSAIHGKTVPLAALDAGRFWPASWTRTGSTTAGEGEGWAGAMHACEYLSTGVTSGYERAHVGS